ncbi:DUF4388 domain-containing protein, partial [bacterium]|nr:DUF4388 domain-containing protein [candidate division CSSED10-310 bacterium]
MTARLPVEGRLMEFPVYRILAEIVGRQRSGILTVSGDDDTVELHFSSGLMVAARSHYAREEIRLGQMMVIRGLCTQEQVSALVEQQKTRLILLGRMACEAGYISEIELSRLLEDQMMLILYTSMVWRQGVYYFQGCDSIPYDRQSLRPVDLKPIFRLGPKIHKSAGWIRERIPDDRAIPERVSGKDVVPEGVQAGHESSDAGPIVLSRAQEKVYERIDGTRSTREVCDSVHLFEWSTRVALIDLMDAGLVVLPLAPKKKKARKKDEPETKEGVGDEKKGSERISRRATMLPLAGRLMPVAGRILAVAGLCGAIIFAAVKIDWTVPKATPKTLEAQTASPKSLTITRYRTDEIRSALVVFYLFNQRYPDELTELVDESLIVQGTIVDGWENPFRYNKLDTGYAVLSTGPDGREGSDDDLLVQGRAGEHMFGSYFPGSVVRSADG